MKKFLLAPICTKNSPARLPTQYAQIVFTLLKPLISD